MKLLAFFTCLSIVACLNGQKTDQEVSTLTKIGQSVPSFNFQTGDGKTININDYKGKPILINFFATWCPPCMKELPKIEKHIWGKYKDRGLVVLAFGRGHKAKEMEEFKQKKGFTFNILADPQKKHYKLFATMYIPRNILIDKQGKIIFQCIGFKDQDFKKLEELIQEQTR